MTEAEVKDALEPFRRVTTEARRAGTGSAPLTKALAEANRANSAGRANPERTLVEITFPTTRCSPNSQPKLLQKRREKPPGRPVHR